LKKAPSNNPAKAKIGRPSSFNQAVADYICEQLALGRSLRSICRSPTLPDQTTVFRWLQNNLDFRQQYARAREFQADTYADEIVDIADGAQDVNLARLQVDARKWTAAKLRPHRYGDRTTVDSAGSGCSAVAPVVEVKLTEEDRKALLEILE
jgi:hypothetical protein